MEKGIWDYSCTYQAPWGAEAAGLCWSTLAWAGGCSGGGKELKMAPETLPNCLTKHPSRATLSWKTTEEKITECFILFPWCDGINPF